MGYAPKFFGCDGMDGILQVYNFDTKLAEGLMLLTPFAADADDELTQKFVTALKRNTARHRSSSLMHTMRSMRSKLLLRKLASHRRLLQAIHATR